MSTKDSHTILKNIEALIVDREYELAEKYLVEFIKKDFNNPEAHYLLSEVYCKLEKFRLAVEQEELANSLLPNNPQIIHLLGWSHHMNGNIKLGRKYMETALFITPEDIHLLCDLAVLEMRVNNSKALTYIEKAMKISPNDPLVQEVSLVVNTLFQLLQKQKNKSN